MKKFLSVLTIAVVGTITLSGCATRAQPNEIILYYKDGVGDNKTFVECIEPSTSGKYPIDDITISLPTDLRTWNIREDGSGDTTNAIISGTRPVEGGSGPEVKIYATAEFVLNTSCDGEKDSPIVNFWETVGRRYDANTPEGWLKMLQNTVVPAEETAFRSTTREYVADDLVYNTNGVWTELSKKVAEVFVDELAKKTGGRSDFFCNPSFDRRQNNCSDISISITDVNYVNSGIQEARDNVRAESERAKAALIAAQSKVDVAKKTAEATALNKDYIRLQELETELEIAREQTRMAEKCAANQNCTVIVGGNANVFPGR